MTDFGEDDFFVASLKGTILKINPAARIMDITHRARSFDPKMTGFILFACYKYFPEGTIFLIVVDPGVGSSRRILLAGTESYSSVEKGELLFLVGSLGFIEVAAREDSASQRLKAKPGDPVKIVFRQ